jgi:hypothetical protein
MPYLYYAALLSNFFQSVETQEEVASAMGPTIANQALLTCRV